MTSSILRVIAARGQRARRAINVAVDDVVAMKIEADVPTKVIDSEQPIPDGYMGLDIGPKTVKLYATEIADACTIVWNGPMGVFETPTFATGTKKIAKRSQRMRTLHPLSEAATRSLLCNQAGVADKISHISTGRRFAGVP